MEAVELHQNESREVSKDAITIRDLRWPAYIPIAVCVGLVGWIYGPTFHMWYVQWMAKESYYSHGILIPAISLFLIWLNKKNLRSIPIASYAPGYIVTSAAIVGIVLAGWAHANTVVGLTFPVLLGGLVMVLFGRQMARQLAFPIGYLYFMCVLPAFIITMLSFRIQMLSTAVATFMLRAMNFDAYREGTMIIMPNLPVYVGAACSGFRMTVTLIAITALFLYITEGPRLGRAILLLSTLPLAVLVNSIRIALVSIVGEYQGSDAMRFFHDNVAPYVEIVMAFALLILIAWLVKCLKFNSVLMS
jgi:exosortase